MNIKKNEINSEYWYGVMHLSLHFQKNLWLSAFISGPGKFEDCRDCFAKAAKSCKEIPAW